MSTQHSGSASPSSPSSEHPAAPKSGRNRSLLLLGVLVLLLIALWYDYKVARPQVETAYDSIAKINEELNSLPGKKYVTDKEVQQKLNRKPASVIQEGPYHVEVYSYRSGLPIRSHNYYAVYSAGTPLVFLKHYKFELPMEELKVAAIGAISEEDAAADAAANREGIMAASAQDRSDSRPPLEAVSADAPKGSEKASDSFPQKSETKEAETKEPAATEPAATEKTEAKEPAATEPAKTSDAPAPAETKSP